MKEARMAIIRNGRPAAEPLGLGGEGFLPNLYDLAIFILVAGVFVLIAHGAHEMTAPAARAGQRAHHARSAKSAGYALRTTLRMFAPSSSRCCSPSWWPRSAAKSRTAPSW